MMRLWWELERWTTTPAMVRWGRWRGAGMRNSAHDWRRKLRRNYDSSKWISDKFWNYIKFNHKNEQISFASAISIQHNSRLSYPPPTIRRHRSSSIFSFVAFFTLFLSLRPIFIVRRQLFARTLIGWIAPVTYFASGFQINSSSSDEGCKMGKLNESQTKV